MESKFNHDGLVIYEKDGHGLVAANIDFVARSWEVAQKTCKELTFENHSDWRLPTQKELDMIKTKFKSKSQISFFFKDESDPYYNNDNNGPIDYVYVNFIAVRTF